MTEEWRDIPGYEGLYKVSNAGTVKSVDREIKRSSGPMRIKSRIVKQGHNGNGYKIVSLYKNGKGRTFTVHRLVLLSFVDNRERKRCINHKDGVKTNNLLSNLEWASHAENNRHAFMSGLREMPSGEDHFRSKKVINVRNGLVYNCVRDAAKAEGMSYSTLTKRLRGDRKNNTCLIYA